MTRPGLLLALIFGSALSAQQRQVVGRVARATAAIRIENPAGAVRVIGWDRDSLDVTTVLGAAIQHLIVQGTADSLTVRIDGPLSGVTDLEVRLPARARLWIRTAAGEIDADQLTGSVTALTISGRLRVGGKVTRATVESLEGNIEVAADAAEATARGGSGTVVLRGSILTATATSVSGALLIGLTGPLAHGRFESLSGNVSFKGPLTADGSLELQSHSGDLDIRISPTLGARYDIETYGGSISDQLRQTTPKLLSGSAHFTIGDGKATVTVRNFKGRVTLLKQETLGARQ